MFILSNPIIFLQIFITGIVAPPLVFRNGNGPSFTNKINPVKFGVTSTFLPQAFSTARTGIPKEAIYEVMAEGVNNDYELDEWNIYKPKLNHQ